MDILPFLTVTFSSVISLTSITVAFFVSFVLFAVLFLLFQVQKNAFLSEKSFKNKTKMVQECSTKTPRISHERSLKAPSRFFSASGLPSENLLGTFRLHTSKSQSILGNLHRATPHCGLTHTLYHTTAQWNSGCNLSKITIIGNNCFSLSF